MDLVRHRVRYLEPLRLGRLSVPCNIFRPTTMYPLFSYSLVISAASSCGASLGPLSNSYTGPSLALLCHWLWTRWFAKICCTEWSPLNASFATRVLNPAMNFRLSAISLSPFNPGEVPSVD